MPDGGVRPQRVSTIDVLERVLDKGIVIDTQIDISVAGIRLINVDARVLVSSFATYLRYADALASASVTLPPATLPAHARPLPRRLPGRSRRPRRVVLACASGCTFRRSLAARQTADAVSCPYRAARVCVLKRLAA